MDILLKAGDVLIDVISNETGVLLRKIDLFSHTVDPKYPALNAWEIIWSGQSLRGTGERVYTYTEEGLLNMIIEGRIKLL